MKRKKLLAKINENLCGRDGCDGEHYKKDNLHGEWFALRAVVELHKVSDVGLFCDGCARFVEPYPCPTIKAIEKELNL